jgi:hypothetical protein
MPGDAVAETMELLAPDVIDKMAAATGLDLATTRQAVQAAIPAILSGLIEIVCKPAGVRRLACAVVKHPADPWRGVAHTADGAAHLAQGDGNLLVSLLGGESVAALASSIGKLSGASDDAMRTLLSLLAPAIVCALGQERRNAGVDALGIADVLQSQKELIAAAMPAGLASLLQSGGFYEYLGVATSPARRGRTTRALAAASAYWALPVLALAGLVWFMLSDTANWKVAGGLAASTTQTADGFADDIAIVAAIRGDWVSSGAYQGRAIYSRAGVKLGTVADLVIAPDGRIVAAVIDVEGSLGIGHKDVAMPFSVLRHSQPRSDGHLLVDVASDRLRTAPAVELSGGRMPLRAQDSEDSATDRLSERRLDPR